MEHCSFPNVFPIKHSDFQWWMAMFDCNRLPVPSGYIWINYKARKSSAVSERFPMIPLLITKVHHMGLLQIYEVPWNWVGIVFPIQMVISIPQVTMARPIPAASRVTGSEATAEAQRGQQRLRARRANPADPTDHPGQCLDPGARSPHVATCGLVLFRDIGAAIGSLIFFFVDEAVNQHVCKPTCFCGGIK